MFLDVKPSPPAIYLNSLQSGKLSNSYAGFTQQLFEGQFLIDLTGVFLVGKEANSNDFNLSYSLIVSGSTSGVVSGNFNSYFNSGASGDYRGSIVPNSFYPTGFSGEFEVFSPAISVIQFIEITGSTTGAPYFFLGSGWIASGSILQQLTEYDPLEYNLLNFYPRDFINLCEDSLSGTGILTLDVNDSEAHASGISKITGDFDKYYSNCSSGSPQFSYEILSAAATGISGSDCCGIHYYDIYPSGEYGNYVFIKLDGNHQTFTGNETGFPSGLLFPNYVIDFATGLSGLIDFYYTGGHLDCPPIAISGISTGLSGVFAQVQILNGDVYNAVTFNCLATGQMAVSGYKVSVDINCSGDCIDTTDFSPVNSILYSKNLLSFIVPKVIIPGDYDLRIENPYGKSTVVDALRVLAPPSVSLSGILGSQMLVSADDWPSFSEVAGSAEFLLNILTQFYDGTRPNAFGLLPPLVLTQWDHVPDIADSVGFDFSMSTTLPTDLGSYGAVLLLVAADCPSPAQAEAIVEYYREGGNVAIFFGFDYATSPGALSIINEIGLSGEGIDGFAGTFPILSSHRFLAGIDTLTFHNPIHLVNINPALNQSIYTIAPASAGEVVEEVNLIYCNS